MLSYLGSEQGLQVIIQAGKAVIQDEDILNITPLADTFQGIITGKFG